MNRRLALVIGCAALAACRGKQAEPAPHDHVAPTAEKPATSSDGGHSAHGGHPSIAGYAPVVVDPARQQLLGIKTAPVG